MTTNHTTELDIADELLALSSSEKAGVLCIRAADELTRLRAENAELRAEREAMAKQPVVAWLHCMVYETGESSCRVSFSEQHPFGVAGQDYSETFPVTTEPLYASPVPIPEGWQPIETAPKDGTEILAWGEQLGHFVVGWDDTTQGPGFNWATADGLNYHKEAFSKWMPLPAAPKP